MSEGIEATLFGIAALLIACIGLYFLYYLYNTNTKITRFMIFCSGVVATFITIFFVFYQKNLIFKGGGIKHSEEIIRDLQVIGDGIGSIFAILVFYALMFIYSAIPFGFFHKSYRWIKGDDF